MIFNSLDSKIDNEKAKKYFHIISWRKSRLAGVSVSLTNNINLTSLIMIDKGVLVAKAPWNTVKSKKTNKTADYFHV
jgi:hypothetical protein